MLPVELLAVSQFDLMYAWYSAPLPPFETWSPVSLAGASDQNLTSGTVAASDIVVLVLGHILSNSANILLI